MSFQVVFILPADLVDRRGGEVVVVIAELERRKGQNFKNTFLVERKSELGYLIAEEAT